MCTSIEEFYFQTFETSVKMYVSGLNGACSILEDQNGCKGAKAAILKMTLPSLENLKDMMEALNLISSLLVKDTKEVDHLKRIQDEALEAHTRMSKALLKILRESEKEEDSHQHFDWESVFRR